MAPSFWGPEFPPQPAAVFDDLAPVEAEEEAEDAYEDEMEEEEEEEGDGGEQHEHGSDGEVVPMYTDDLLVLRFPGAVHIFMSVSPDKVSQVEAALSLQGRLDPADSTAVPPAAGNMLTMSFRGQEYKFDSVTPDEVQDILLSLGGSELMIPAIQLNMFFPGQSRVFHSVSADKVRAVLSLLGGVDLTVSTAVPWALNNQLTEPLLCCIFVLDHAVPDKVQAVLSLLEGGELNPGIEVEFPTPLASLKFDKKIRYTVRKKVALRMQRNRCQFTSSRPKPDEATSELATPDGSPNRD